eukprot:3508961-Rhodomonas_salina.1
MRPDSLAPARSIVCTVTISPILALPPSRSDAGLGRMLVAWCLMRVTTWLPEIIGYCGQLAKHVVLVHHVARCFDGVESLRDGTLRVSELRRVEIILASAVVAMIAVVVASRLRATLAISTVIVIAIATALVAIVASVIAAPVVATVVVVASVVVAASVAVARVAPVVSAASIIIAAPAVRAAGGSALSGSGLLLPALVLVSGKLDLLWLDPCDAGCRRAATCN